MAIIIYLMSNSLFTWQEWARARRLAPRAQVRRDLMITKLPLRGRRAADWKHMLRLRRAYAMTYGKCWRSCAPAGAHSPPFPPPLVGARSWRRTAQTNHLRPSRSAFTLDSNQVAPSD